MKTHQKNNRTSQAGFTLVVAVVITAMLLLISFVVADLATKELLIAQSGKDSQYAFYNAYNGSECAIYWDLNNNQAYTSAFNVNAPGSISCNNQTVTTGSETVPTVPGTPALVGGGGSGNPTSIFSINFSPGCAIVRVTKNPNNTTTVDSRGYNTCDTSSPRRFERGITLTY